MRTPFTDIAAFADKLAVKAGGESMTYGELDRQSRALATHLHAAGFVHGDVIAVLAANTTGFFVAAWAGQRSGLYYTPVGKYLKAHEIAYQLADSGAKALFVDQALGAEARNALAQLPASDRPRAYALSGEIEGMERLADAIADGEGLPEIEDIEGGDLLYTSGTTGKPKGVKRPLPLGPLGSDMRRVERMTELFGMTEATVFYTAAPIYHAAPLRFAMTVLKMGATLILDSRFDPAGALETIAREGVTHSQWVPTMFVRLLDLPQEVRTGWKATAHVKAIHSGAPCPRPVKQSMIDWWGPILHEYYSGTESAGFTHIDSPDWLRFPGSVGQAWGCKIHILDDEFNELPVGQIGNVYFEGRGGLKYHNADDKTKEAHSPQGWATMGDIGHVNDEGFLFLSDRKKFVIISGGVNIYPKEIEEAAEAHELVQECAVFGVPDAEFGEAVQAVVQLRDPAKAGAETAGVLHVFLRERLAGFKAPRFIDFIGDLPRLPNGKIEKHRLKDTYRDKSDRGFAYRKSVHA